MPNWVYSRLVVTGPENKIKAFKKAHFRTLDYGEPKKEFGLDFQTVIPVPEDGTINDAIEAWGVKWNSHQNKIIKDSPGGLDFTFRTPWGIPDLVLKELAVRWLDLEFAYVAVEEGFEFGAVGLFMDGEGQIEPSPVTPAMYSWVFQKEPSDQELAWMLKAAKRHPELLSPVGTSTATVVGAIAIAAGVGAGIYAARHWIYPPTTPPP